MNRTIAALVVLALFPCFAVAQGLEITNVRPSYGPSGATRKADKVMVRDALWVNFDIDGLTPEKKSGKLVYQTLIEVLDSDKKVKFSQKGGGEFVPILGGSRAPSDFHLVFGDAFMPGKYVVRISVTDKVSNPNEKKSLDYPLQVIPSDFGIYGVVAQGTALRAQDYIFTFGLGQFKLNAKKQPDAEVNIRILDSAGKPVGPATQLLLPQAIPAGVEVDKVQFVPFTYPMFLNRTGQFTIEITAVDKLAKTKEAKLSFQLSVVDPGSK